MAFSRFVQVCSCQQVTPTAVRCSLGAAMEMYPRVPEQSLVTSFAPVPPTADRTAALGYLR